MEDLGGNRPGHRPELLVQIETPDQRSFHRMGGSEADRLHDFQEGPPPRCVYRGPRLPGRKGGQDGSRRLPARGGRASQGGRDGLALKVHQGQRKENGGMDFLVTQKGGKVDIPAARIGEPVGYEGILCSMLQIPADLVQLVGELAADIRDLAGQIRSDALFQQPPHGQIAAAAYHGEHHRGPQQHRESQAIRQAGVQPVLQGRPGLRQTQPPAPASAVRARLRDGYGQWHDPPGHNGP